MPEPSVLIVGAGPTGMNLALRLRHHGVPFRIIDTHDGPAQESRALVVQARTLEFYRQLGHADAAVAKGVVIAGAQFHEAGKVIARIDFGQVDADLSPYPFALDLPQDEHERLLDTWLRGAGVTIERGTTLAALAQDDAGATATLTRSDGHSETARFAYVAGCDGARSTVRAAIGAAFPGGTYQHLYYVADVTLVEPDGGHDLHVALGKDSVAVRLPSRQGATERLIGFVPDGIAQPGFEDVRESAERLTGVRVAEVNWFSTYRVHHRVADRFRAGRAFLCGDAGHLHSPVGGQGMNTGIGDAINLSWKLAAVLQGRAAPALLDSYEPERIAFARDLVATTDRAFKALTAQNMLGELARRWLVPTVVPAAMGFEGGRTAFFRLLSQTRIAYRHSPLSAGKAGRVHGGDRLPWVRAIDNFAPLASLDWQLHSYGAENVALAQAARAMGLAQHVFDWSEAVAKAGLARDAAYLVRPDGHVALAMPTPEVAALHAYVAGHGLRFAG